MNVIPNDFRVKKREKLIQIFSINNELSLK
jgi:hypothetical protein